jgi:lipoate-protein ligase B
VELDHVMFHLDGAAVVCLLLQLGKETTSFIHLVRALERSVVVVLC